MKADKNNALMVKVSNSQNFPLEFSKYKIKTVS